MSELHRLPRKLSVVRASWTDRHGVTHRVRLASLRNVAALITCTMSRPTYVDRNEAARIVTCLACAAGLPRYYKKEPW